MVVLAVVVLAVVVLAVVVLVVVVLVVVVLVVGVLVVVVVVPAMSWSSSLCCPRLFHPLPCARLGVEVSQVS